MFGKSIQYIYYIVFCYGAALNDKFRSSNRALEETNWPGRDRTCKKAEIYYLQKRKSFLLLIYQTLLVYKV